MGSLGCMGCFKVSHKAYTGVSAHTWTLTPHTHQYLPDVSSPTTYSAGSAEEKFSLNRCVSPPFLSAPRGFLFVLHVLSFVLFASFPSRLLTSSPWATPTVWPDISASSMLIRPTWPLLVLHHYFPSFRFSYFQLTCPLQTLPSPAYFLLSATFPCLTSWYFESCSFFACLAVVLQRRGHSEFSVPLAGSRWRNHWCEFPRCLVRTPRTRFFFTPFFFLSPFLLPTQPFLS